MFVLKSTHEAEIKKLRAEIAKTGVLLQSARDGQAIAERENKTLRSELAPLKAAKERQLQNLRDANARRAQSAFDRALTATN